MKNIITFVLICSFLFAAFSLSGCEKRENNEEIISSEEGVTTTSTDSIVTTYNAVTTEDNDNKQPDIKDVSELETNIDIWNLCAGKTFKEVYDLLGEPEKWRYALSYPFRRGWIINGIDAVFWFKTSEDIETGKEESLRELVLEYQTNHPESIEDVTWIWEIVREYIEGDMFKDLSVYCPSFYKEDDYLYYQEWRNNLIVYKISFQDEEFVLTGNN